MIKSRLRSFWSHKIPLQSSDLTFKLVLTKPTLNEGDCRIVANLPERWVLRRRTQEPVFNFICWILQFPPIYINYSYDFTLWQLNIFDSEDSKTCTCDCLWCDIWLHKINSPEIALAVSVHHFFMKNHLKSLLFNFGACKRCSHDLRVPQCAQENFLLHNYKLRPHNPHFQSHRVPVCSLQSSVASSWANRAGRCRGGHHTRPPGPCSQTPGWGAKACIRAPLRKSPQQTEWAPRWRFLGYGSRRAQQWPSRGWPRASALKASYTQSRFAKAGGHLGPRFSQQHHRFGVSQDLLICTPAHPLGFPALGPANRSLKKWPQINFS